MIPEKRRGLSENARGERRRGKIGLTNIAYTTGCRSGYTRSAVRSTRDAHLSDVSDMSDMKCKGSV